MKNIALSALFGAASLALAACGGGETNTADEAANAAGAVDETMVGGGEGSQTADAGSTGAASTGAAWPRDARIVEENGITYRIDPDGTRVTLAESDSRIVVENGIRYQVDPGGARVRIDERGVGVDIDPPAVDVDTPDVEIEVEPDNATRN